MDVKYKILNLEEQRYHLAHRKEKKSRDALVLGCMPYIINCAQYLAVHKGLNNYVDDLISEGVLGVYKILDRFEDVGNSFLALAKYHIKFEMNEFCRKYFQNIEACKRQYLKGVRPTLRNTEEEVVRLEELAQIDSYCSTLNQKPFERVLRRCTGETSKHIADTEGVSAQTIGQMLHRLEKLL